MSEFSKNDLIMPGIGAGLATIGSAPQWQEAYRLKKERERLLKAGAPGLTATEEGQLASLRGRAASTRGPGFGEEMAGIAQQQGDVLAAGKRGSQTSSNLMNLLGRMNAQGMAARRNIIIRGEQSQKAAQGDYANMALNTDARRQGRVQNWEAKLASMDALRREYNAKKFGAPLQGAIAFMPTSTGSEKDKYLTGKDGKKYYKDYSGQYQLLPELPS